MKKLALIIAFMMILPGAAFGLEMLNDSAMDEITGQSGVHIGFDDVQIFMNIDRISWIDADGFYDHSTTEYGSGGAIGIENFQLDVLKINAIVSSDSTSPATGVVNFASTAAGEIPLQFTYGATTTMPGSTLVISPTQNLYGIENYIEPSRDQESITSGETLYQALSIDATSQLVALSAMAQSNGDGTTGVDMAANVGGVVIGVPTAEFYIGDMVFTPAFYNITTVGIANRAGNAIDNDPLAEYGTFGFEAITFTTLGGYIEIAPH